ncbi:hypothetical protein NT6N_07490 [Oceaniferula spumae]|uniref:DUF2271 domain-containing protein n=1 Tax=Oceaniferula spumae TaxID=2979115 RepID=A0AAT9FI90_9BACT
MKSLLLCCSLILSSVQVFAEKQKKTSKVWEVELVPSRSSEGKGAVLYATKPLDRFYIVLRNVSGKDQRVWREWCSWGYDNVRLTAELEDGTKVTLTKAPKDWDKNYPDAFLVPAGQPYVIEVHLAGAIWKGVDKLPKTPFKLTVTYEIKKTPEAEQKKVWTGSAASKPLTVTLRQ